MVAQTGETVRLVSLSYRHKQMNLPGCCFSFWIREVLPQRILCQNVAAMAIWPTGTSLYKHIPILFWCPLHRQRCCSVREEWYLLVPPKGTSRIVQYQMALELRFQISGSIYRRKSRMCQCLDQGILGAWIGAAFWRSFYAELSLNYWLYLWIFEWSEIDLRGRV